MKNMVLTTDRLVLPLTLEAVSESKIDHGAVMQDESQNAAIMPQPALDVNFMRQMFPAKGGKTRAIATNVRFLGKKLQARIPIHNSKI